MKSIKGSIRLLDTSALAKRYVHEAGTERVVPIIEQGPRGRVQVSYLALLEMRSLLRIARDQGRTTQEQTMVIRAVLTADLQSHITVRDILGADWPVAVSLVDRHGLRPADALHLSSAISLREEVSEESTVELVCSDAALCDAARAEGFEVLDPAASP